MPHLASRVDGNTITTLGGAPLNLGGRVESLTANRTLTKEDNRTLFLCNKAASLTIALPAITSIDAGTTFTFVVQTAVSGGDMTITAQTGDLLKGQVMNVDTDSTNALTFYSPNGSSHLITTLNGSTKGGVGWDVLTYTAISATEWLVTGTVFATGTPATPFS